MFYGSWGWKNNSEIEKHFQNILKKIAKISIVFRVYHRSTKNMAQKKNQKSNYLFFPKVPYQHSQTSNQDNN